MSKYTVIKAELDSNGGLYDAMTDQQVADELNTVDKVQNRTGMGRSEIYENIEASALAALTATELAQINLAMSDTVDPFGNAAQVFTDIFTGGSATVLALAAARVETVSRASQIGVSNVAENDIIIARAQ